MGNFRTSNAAATLSEENDLLFWIHAHEFSKNGGVAAGGFPVSIPAFGKLLLIFTVFLLGKCDASLEFLGKA